MKKTLTLIRYALAGIAFVLICLLSFGYLTQQNHTVKSFLDGRVLTEFHVPTKSTFLDGSWMKETEGYVDDRMVGRRLLLTLHAAVATKVFRSNEISGVWIDRKTGMLQEDMPVLAPIERLDAGLTNLQAITTTNHVPLLFVYIPKKQEAFADVLPKNWDNVYLDNKPSVLAEFAKHGPVLDLTPTVSDKSTRMKDWFLTDHHWSQYGAMAASTAVRNQLNLMGLPAPTALPTMDISTKYPNFIGSIGRRITTAGVPKRDPFTVTWSSKSDLTHCMNRSIHRAVCNDPIFSKARGYQKDVYSNRYGTFMGGDNGIDDLRGNGTGTYIILKDSFGDSFVPYFALGAKRVVAIDERHYSGEALSKLIADVKPNGVIFMHNQLTMSTFTDHEIAAWR